MRPSGSQATSLHVDGALGRTGLADSCSEGTEKPQNSQGLRLW